ncbi:hypothetical protein MmiHf6_14300 [Methanimicrococcus hongohii]|uniref:GLUG domain-containing protein n=1 Tax=Methanimicrococcus hongohii TaxID=3028295 RepID=A0AA96V0G8_9EURY|nr:hypothetical protein [Methanimicrococcus sp. Hf6]WNY24101.1 hypothetical protein MmiHf6_14300 [Methanimicrococcus sp. Hf6]
MFYLVTFSDAFLSISTAAADSEPTLISTADELAQIGDSEENLSKSYILTENIDLSEYNGGIWIPIGTADSPFTGNFDGNNKTISNMNINCEVPLTNFGLFGSAKEAKINNVVLADAKIQAEILDATTDMYFGLISGFAQNSSVRNSQILNGTVLISGKSTSDLYVGGLVGRVNESFIDNCIVNADIKNADPNVEVECYYLFAGGIIGCGQHNVIFNSGTSSTINVNVNSTNAYVGGIAGYSTVYISQVCIMNSYSLSDIIVKGSVTGGNYPVGGIAGYLCDDAVNNYFAGNISNMDDNPKKIGAVFGVACYDAEIAENTIANSLIQYNYYDNSLEYPGVSAVSSKTGVTEIPEEWTTKLANSNMIALKGNDALVTLLNQNIPFLLETADSHRGLLGDSTWKDLVQKHDVEVMFYSWTIRSGEYPTLKTSESARKGGNGFGQATVIDPVPVETVESDKKTDVENYPEETILPVRGEETNDNLTSDSYGSETPNSKILYYILGAGFLILLGSIGWIVLRKR